MSADREQELVLGRRQPGRLGLLLAPAQKATQTRAQLQQPSEVLLAEGHVAPRYRARPRRAEVAFEGAPNPRAVTARLRKLNLWSVSPRSDPLAARQAYIPSLKRRRTCFSGSSSPRASTPSLKRPRCK